MGKEITMLKAQAAVDRDSMGKEITVIRAQFTGNKPSRLKRQSRSDDRKACVSREGNTT